MPAPLVLLDLDGTLIDSAPGITSCVAAAYRDAGLPVPSPVELRSFIGPAIHDSLRRHGVPVEPRHLGEPDSAAGEVLLAQAGDAGADLLVMGAYGHARLRELVFSGATRHVLREAELPVLLGG